MKTFRIFFILFLISLISCCNDNESEILDYRLIAYNSLSEEEKETISEDWNNAEIIFGKYKSDVCEHALYSVDRGLMCFLLKDQNIQLEENQNLTAVIFNTINDSLLGPIIVVIDPVSESAVGSVLRL